ncbi:MaoC family dehydratase [Aeromonas veronii]|uniref:MaoC family dehydratase n=1 Tax=Aeromonas veronii TaxID=654 RepID=UPI0028534DBB|nr:MaoC family dehydratase [Aeromonas veronii]MDR5012741.1 MaoC family dehydratase [Aeromonas veronii]HDO1382723.1 MaoC family dehydratase [Aeromonas veronii]
MKSEKTDLTNTDVINAFSVGMTESYSQTITDSDIKSFSGISGDKNPVHMSDDFALNTQFKRRIAHGLMSASYFSALFGMKIPGPGCVYLSQSLKFLKPVYIGDTVTAKVTITKLNKRSRRFTFETCCYVDGVEVIVGEAEIFLPKLQ